MSRRASRGGFTLIELVIAMVIGAVLFAAIVLGVGALTGSQARSTAGELGGIIRSLYDTAALTGKTCRLVFEMPGEKEDEGSTKYWAECAAGNVTTDRDREEALKDANRADKREDDESRRSSSSSSTPTLEDMIAAEKERVENAAKFSAFTSEEIAPRAVPNTVRLSVWTRHQRQAVSSGTAYLYFFPQGFTEKAHIYVRQGSNAWTLTVAPLTGKTAVVADELEVPRS
jgi:general secretion pathway protein H